MKFTKLIPFVAFTLVAGAGTAQAQEGEAEERDKKGFLTGSFETNNIYFVKEDIEVPGQKTPDDRFGSNNYLKVDYIRSKFSAGVQLESYLPVIQDYPAEFTGTKLTNIYASWVDD